MFKLETHLSAAHRARIDAARRDAIRAKKSAISAEAMARSRPAGLRKSLIPLTIICGAPASGKSSHVERHAGADDLVIDLDRIFAAIGAGDGHEGSRLRIEEALDERNRLLRSEFAI